MAMELEIFEGTLISWEELCANAMAEAPDLQPEQLVSISHSDDKGKGLVVLWFWGV